MFWRSVKFCSDFFGHARKQLDNKAKINLTSQPGKQTNRIYMLPNNSRKKGNHTRKAKIFFFKHHAENETGIIFPEFFFLFKEAPLEVN